MDNMQKKAQQTGSSAAVLILLIAMLLVLYILFIPPQERAVLLNGENASEPVSEKGAALLLVNPGRLDVIKENEITHNIGTLYLVSKTEASVLASKPSLTASATSFK